MDNLTLFVSSADSYSDCWLPFFELLEKNWPECNFNIILNSEKKVFTYKNLPILCPVVQNKHKDTLPWGRRLKETLEYVQTDYILWILDDFFIRSKVNHRAFLEIFSYMIQNNIPHVSLMDQPGPNYEIAFDKLVARGRESKYLISLQVGLWKTEVFNKYVLDHESPWNMELLGTKRAYVYSESFYSLNPKYIEKEDYIFNYLFDCKGDKLTTGAIKRGKWISEVPDFLNNEGIRHSIDFSIRGFSNVNEKRKFSQRLQNRLSFNTNKTLLLSFFHLLNIKLNAYLKKGHKKTDRILCHE